MATFGHDWLDHLRQLRREREMLCRTQPPRGTGPEEVVELLLWQARRVTALLEELGTALSVEEQRALRRAASEFKVEALWVRQDGMGPPIKRIGGR